MNLVNSKTFAVLSLLLLQSPGPSSALLYIVRQNCTRRQIFTPVPSTVSNYCLQCLCVMSNISYCKPLIVQLSVICSAALVATTVRAQVVAVTTARPAAITAAPVTVMVTTARPAVTVPALVVPTAAPTTPVNINPRASTAAPAPAAGGMISGATVMMVTIPPIMMMMMMAAAGGNSSMTMAMTPAPAG